MANSRDLANFGDTLSGVSNVNIDSGTLFVDATNNRVGIGTTSPVKSLVVSNSGAFGFEVSPNDAAQSYNRLINYNRSTNQYAPVRYEGSTHAFYANTDGTVLAASINTSGHVTMPSKPLFMGAPTTDYSGGSMPTGVILFTASINNGSNYNGTNGRFTAPTAGWYRTTWGGLQLAATVTSLQVNGSDVHNGNHFATGTTGTPTYVNMTQTTIRYLNAGDYLTIRGWNGGGYYAVWYIWTVELIA